MDSIHKLINKIVYPAPFISGGIAILLLMAGCLGPGLVREAGGYRAGVYEGTGRGFRGPIVVQVQMSPAGIEDVIILSHRETAYPGAAAMEELLELVLETGSTDLDVVSGASVSSRGFLEAVEDAKSRQSTQRRCNTHH